MAGPSSIAAFCLLVAWQMSLGAGMRSVQNEDSQLTPLENVLTVAKMGQPKGMDPVELSGHYPALEVYKTPDERVRVEGINVGPGDSIAAGQGDTPVLKAMLVYAVDSRTTGVELKLPDFFLPHDERILEVWNQGELVHKCEVPSTEVCKYDFDYGADAVLGKRYTVKALRAHDRSVLQEERVYTPYPYMCAASLFTRPDISSMDCSTLESFPEPVITDFSSTSTRGFAIELEFMAKDGTLKEAVGGAGPLERVRQCADKMVNGTEFEKLSHTWNWMEEPSMVPFGPRDHVPASEYVGLMAELTSPGPPVVLFGQEGIADVGRVLHTATRMGTQVGLWAQFHVHVNVRSPKANPASACCLNADQVINIWTAWSKYQMVIDEMQNPTNVDNIWAKPLYMDDLLAQSVFTNMHANRGKDVAIENACEVFYGEGNCDSKSHAGWKPPASEGVNFGIYHHGPPRYYAVNLAPLPDKGTIEIRQQAGTLDSERAQRWVQFVLAFVETFKSGQGMDDLFDDSVENDVEDLKQAQTAASFDTLFEALGGRIDGASKDYYKQRLWIKNDPKCVFGDKA